MGSIALWCCSQRTDAPFKFSPCFSCTLCVSTRTLIQGEKRAHDDLPQLQYGGTHREVPALVPPAERVLRVEVASGRNSGCPAEQVADEVAARKRAVGRELETEVTQAGNQPANVQ